MDENPAPTTPATSDGAARWQARYDAAQAKGQVRDADFTTLSQMEVEPVYGPADGSEVPERIGWPGEYPFTRRSEERRVGKECRARGAPRESERRDSNGVC